MDRSTTIASLKWIWRGNVGSRHFLFSDSLREREREIKLACWKKQRLKAIFAKRMVLGLLVIWLARKEEKTMHAHIHTHSPTHMCARERTCAHMSIGMSLLRSVLVQNNPQFRWKRRKCLARKKSMALSWTKRKRRFQGQQWPWNNKIAFVTKGNAMFDTFLYWFHSISKWPFCSLLFLGRNKFTNFSQWKWCVSGLKSTRRMYEYSSYCKRDTYTIISAYCLKLKLNK